MNATLTQRKYRLVAGLATDGAKTYGIAWAAAFIALLVVSAIIRQVVGEYRDYAVFAVVAIPLVTGILGWSGMYRSYPRALTNGVTRKEFLAAFAMFGVALVLASAALSQLGLRVINLFSTFRGAEYDTGFYGVGLPDSMARAVLWFACGALIGAVMHRVPTRRLGLLVSALILAVAYFRRDWLWTNAVPLIYGDVVDMTEIAAIDAVFAIPFLLAAWVLAMRAPLPPKRA